MDWLEPILKNVSDDQKDVIRKILEKKYEEILDNVPSHERDIAKKILENRHSIIAIPNPGDVLDVVGVKLPDTDLSELAKCMKCNKIYRKLTIRDGVCVDCIRTANNNLEFSNNNLKLDLNMRDSIVRSFFAKMTDTNLQSEGMDEVFHRLNALASQIESARNFLHKIFDEELAFDTNLPGDILSSVSAIGGIIARHKTTSERLASELLEARKKIKKYETTLSVEQGTRKLDL